jgi:voltage-gated potassium channel
VDRLRAYLHRQLFVGICPDGRLTWMNRVLVVAILAAVVSAVIATEAQITGRWQRTLLIAEAGFGVIFLFEYLARIFAAADQPGPGSAWRKRWRFIRSPIGLIDLVVVLATLMPLVLADATMLRMVRLLRVAAIGKFGRFSRALKEIGSALAERGDDLLVTIALAAVFLLFGATALYLAEGHLQPDKFGSIPRALWWAVVTFATVGYGDAVPITPLGKFLAGIVALGGIAFVAMPTGIIAAAFSEAMQRRRDLRIEEMRGHLARLDQVDEEVEAKIAALERTSKPKP